MKVRFVLVSFGGQILAITICARRLPNYVKHLLSGLNNALKGTFHLQCSHFAVLIAPPISDVFALTGISVRGPQGRSDTALRLDSS